MTSSRAALIAGNFQEHQQHHGLQQLHELQQQQPLVHQQAAQDAGDQVVPAASTIVMIGTATQDSTSLGHERAHDVADSHAADLLQVVPVHVVSLEDQAAAASATASATASAAASATASARFRLATNSCKTRFRKRLLMARIITSKLRAIGHHTTRSRRPRNLQAQEQQQQQHEQQQQQQDQHQQPKITQISTTAFISMQLTDSLARIHELEATTRGLRDGIDRAVQILQGAVLCTSCMTYPATYTIHSVSSGQHTTCDRCIASNAPKLAGLDASWQFCTLCNVPGQWPRFAPLSSVHADTAVALHILEDQLATATATATAPSTGTNYSSTPTRHDSVRRVLQFFSDSDDS